MAVRRAVRKWLCGERGRLGLFGLATQAGVVGTKFHVVGLQNPDNVYAETVADGSADGGTLARATGVGFPRDQRDCAF